MYIYIRLAARFLRALHLNIFEQPHKIGFIKYLTTFNIIKNQKGLFNILVFFLISIRFS
jgi:hypothetical protein